MKTLFFLIAAFVSMPALAQSKDSRGQCRRTVAHRHWLVGYAAVQTDGKVVIRSVDLMTDIMASNNGLQKMIIAEEGLKEVTIISLYEFKTEAEYKSFYRK